MISFDEYTIQKALGLIVSKYLWIYYIHEESISLPNTANDLMQLLSSKFVHVSCVHAQIGSHCRMPSPIQYGVAEIILFVKGTQEDVTSEIASIRSSTNVSGMVKLLNIELSENCTYDKNRT